MSDIIVRDEEYAKQWDLNVERRRIDKKVKLAEMRAKENSSKLTTQQKRDVKAKVKAQLAGLKKNKKS